MLTRKVIKNNIGVLLVCYMCNIAIANTSSGSLPISTLVSANCSVGSTSINFGNYDPLNANATSPLRSSTTFQIACTKGANVSITMNNGQYGTNATQTTRAMSDSNNHYLSYELYSNSGYSTVWNSTNPVRFTPTSSSGLTQTIYGQIPASQNPYAGHYADTVLIIATF